MGGGSNDTSLVHKVFNPATGKIEVVPAAGK